MFRVENVLSLSTGGESWMDTPYPISRCAIQVGRVSGRPSRLEDILLSAHRGRNGRQMSPVRFVQRKYTLLKQQLSTHPFYHEEAAWQYRIGAHTRD